VFSAKFQDSGVLQVLYYTMHAIFADFFARLAAGQLDSSILGSFEKIEMRRRRRKDTLYLLFPMGWLSIGRL
jgi:hypothetical protein